MSLSSIAVEQREKEAKKLNSFLVFGLISSLALHIGVLSLGIGNFTKKTAEVKDEPLEIEIVDLPDPQKPEIKQSPEAQVSNSNRVLSSASSEGGSIALSSNTPARGLQGSSPSSKPVKVAPSRSAIASEKSPISVAPAKIASPPITQQKPVQTPKTTVTQPAPVAKVTAPSEIATQSKLITPPPLVAASPKPAQTQKASVPSPISSQPENNQQLRKLLASNRNTQQPNNIGAVSKPSNLSDRQASIANNLRNQRANGVIDGAASSSRIGTGSNPSNGLSNSSTGVTGSNSSASTSSSGTGNNPRGGSNNGTGNGSGNNPSGSSNSGRGNGSSIGANRGSGSNVATGTQNRSPRNTQPESNSNANSRASGLACRSCSKPKYPDKARRRGLEGKAEISVDVDSKGNVTDVRLARSSGHSELDKAALQQARRWKFKAPNGGARGVSAKVDFAIEGSERSRKLRERRKRRQTEQRRSTPTTETANAPLPTRRIRNSTSSQNASSPRRTQTTTSRRRIDTLPPRRTGDRQRPTATQQASSQTRLRQSLRRQRPTSNQATPASQTALRQSLRQLRQNPQPVASPND